LEATKMATAVSPLSQQIATELDETDSWAAVIARDVRRDGDFVYAVATTGVYCRASCPSRRPLRKNVAFYRTPAAAEAAGYRPCLRCHPRDQKKPIDLAVSRARQFLESHLDEAVTLPTLAREVGLSPHHLQREFSRIVGVSPRRYAAALRADRLKAALRDGATVSRATFDAGYSASSRVYEAAEAHLGMTPAAYRRGGKGERIRYTTRSTRFGQVLVAATARGVCAVQLGRDDAVLERGLAAEYPNAERVRLAAKEGGEQNADLRRWADDIVCHLEGAISSLDVPTDVSGTPFEVKVWQTLREIPYGQTRSYSEVARAMGRPRAVRAVAGACARNRVAVVIPCHRVVRQGGEIGGYRWGPERKRQLLALEREHRGDARV
jgi:AraC family transcriptional regulator, regulatory protein of adaptative response / methylated-DNA-[protein]-cysteine methyltransferase